LIVVLDANAIINTLPSPSGTPAEILRRWVADQLEVATSSPLLVAQEGALQYPQVRKCFQRHRAELVAFARPFKGVATVVEPDLTLQVIEEDPPNSRVLECAVAGGASCIVSGNDHLLIPKVSSEIGILSPAGFLTLLDLIQDSDGQPPVASRTRLHRGWDPARRAGVT
jgi:putative PIN family toxin of toxin-antitoxin system